MSSSLQVGYQVATLMNFKCSGEIENTEIGLFFTFFCERQWIQSGQENNSSRRHLQEFTMCFKSALLAGMRTNGNNGPQEIDVQPLATVARQGQGHQYGVRPRLTFRDSY